MQGQRQSPVDIDPDLLLFDPQLPDLHITPSQVRSALTLISLCLTPMYLTFIHTFDLQSKLISIILMSELRRENERKVLIKEMLRI